MIIELPELKDFKCVNVSDRSKIPKVQGIYILCVQGIPDYIGISSNLYNRLLCHNVLKLNAEVNEILYLQVDDIDQLRFFEYAYMFYFFHKLGNRYKQTFPTCKDVSMNEMQSALLKISFD